MKKPTRRVAVITGTITIAVTAITVVAAQGVTLTSADLAANRVSVASPSPSSQSSPLQRSGLPGRAGLDGLSRSAIPSVLPPTVPGAVTSSPTSFTVPGAPGPAPARQNAAAVVVAVNAPAPPKTTKKVSAPAKKSTTSGGSSSGGSSYPEYAAIANALFSQINQERAANGLPALGRSSQLNSSAHGHNVAMANTGQFAHQVTGEASLGARISATGYRWTSAGENIAWGSYASVSFAESLETEMYNEPPNQPNHRANILSSSFHNVGVDVITDASGKMWITCDFGS